MIVLTIVLTSCSVTSVKKVDGPNDIFTKVNVGLSADADLAQNINYYIIDGSIGSVEFEYNGHKYICDATTKFDYKQLEQKRNIVSKSENYYLMTIELFSFYVYNICDNDGNNTGTVVEWKAELSTGTYKAFYVLYSQDYIIDKDNMKEMETILRTIIGM